MPSPKFWPAERAELFRRLLALHAFIRIETDGEVVGWTPDATGGYPLANEVSLGNIGTEKDQQSLLAYLQHHSTPETW